MTLENWSPFSSVIRSSSRRRAKKRSQVTLALELLEQRVVLSSPSLTTTPSAAVTLGSGVNLTDSAVLSGGSDPTGLITFTLTAPGGATVDTEHVSVSGDATYNTPSGYLPTSAGTYQWNASYSGDANNSPATDNNDPTEQVTVSPAQPSLATTPDPTAITLPTGTALSDSATLSGGYNETVSITFTLTAPGGGVLDTDTVPVNGNGTYSTASADVNLVQNGGFETGDLTDWTLSSANSGSLFEVSNSPIAPYDGDYAAEFGATGYSPDSISQTLATVPGETYVLSYWLSHNDSNTENDFQVSWGGTLVQDLSNASAFGWANYTFTVTATSTATVLLFSGYEVPEWFALDDVSVGGFTPTQAGTYQWNASYSGDNNNDSVSDDNDPTEQVAVSPAQPSLLGTPSPTTVTPGPPVTTLTDAVALSGGSDPTGSVTFTLIAPGGGVLDTETVPASGNGTYATPTGYTLPLSPAPGTYQWNAAYDGDTSNDPASDDNDPAEQVTVIPPIAPAFTDDTPPTAAVGAPYSYQFQATGTEPVTFSATGLPAWAQLDPSAGILSGTPPAPGTFDFTVSVSNGTAPDATADVSLLAQYEPPTFTADTPQVAAADSFFSYQFQAVDTGTAPITFSATGLPGWAQLDPSTGVLSGTPTADASFGFTVTATNGVAPDTTVDVSLIVAGGTAATFNVAAGTSFTVPDGTYTDGTTFNVGAGATVTIDAGTFTGGAIFNLSTGAVANIIDSPTFSGTLTGSGDGNVQVGDGRLYVGTGGLTLDFAGSIFQWTSGQLDLGNGNLTNLGTMTITAPVDFYNDGILDNYGTIIQTGSGNLQLGTDGMYPSTLMNEAGAYYLLEGDGGLTEISDSGSAPGQTSLDNAGIIRKTAGTGTSNFTVLGSITNTGTIEADSGTISLDPTLGISQLSGNSLTAGTWSAQSGATLALPSGTSVNTNAGNLSLGGSGAAITGIAGLSSDSGSLTLSGGANFTTNGNFANSGSLTVGAGSSFTVNGNYTQGSAASLTFGLGGAFAGSDFGQLNVSGSATLAGAVNASVVSGFTPPAGDSFPIVTYASETGGDSLSFTGVNSGALSIFQPVVGPTNVVLSTVTSPANLVVQPFNVSANVVAGQNLTVTYQFDNQSGNPATGSWTDSVYLSTQTTLNSDSVLLGRVQHTGGVAANGQYTESLTAPVPGLAPDNYYVVVLADSLGLVPELNRTDAELASTNPVQVTVAGLSIGSSVSGTIDNGQDIFYELNLPAGQDVAISAGLAALQGGELYVGYQSVPTTSTYEASSTSPSQIDQQVVIPDAQAGTYYVLLQGDTGSTGGKPFTLSAQTLPLQVTSASPSEAGNVGTTTLTIQGAEFTASVAVSLVPHGGGTPITATQVTFQGSTTLFAQFNLAGAAPGRYDVLVTDGAQNATDPSAFAVTSSAAPGHISYHLSVPSISRPGRIAYLTLTYTNDGGSDALAPLFVVSAASDNATIGLPGQTSFSGSSVQILGIETSGPAGTLPPGYQGTLEIPYESTTLQAGAEINFSLQILTGDSTPMNWSSLESSLEPSYIPSTAWPAVFANLTAEVGSTTDSYLTYLDSEATYLSQLGEYTNDAQRLFGFAINTANDSLTTGAIDSVTDASFPVPGAVPLDFVREFNASISGRDTMGPFGLGWTDNWQVSAGADSLGNVTITDDGALLYFAKNALDSYTPSPGEYGTLTLANGAYQYVQTDGTILAFNPNGSLDYEQDTNGNRITAGYNASGGLTSLTASNGSAITIAYNAQGLVSSITEPGSQTTTYAYDSSSKHLLTFTDEFGTTTYTYSAGPGAADVNALTSITFADGTGLQWTYDARGRIATAGRLGGAETETYAYPLPGGYRVTDADGNTTTHLIDDHGDCCTIIDPLGNVTQYVFDANDNLVKVVAADGATTTYTYRSFAATKGLALRELRLAA